MMFYQGDLQSGIALAVRDAKSVVCFVRDEAEESTLWENEYFDEELSQLLAENVVALRLAAGSQEAGFLASLCPINTFPTLLVIRNGTVQEYIVAGTSKEEFQKRLKAVITSNPPSDVAQSSPPARPDVVADTTNSTTTNPPDPVPATQPQTSTTVQAAADTSDRANRRNIRAGKQPARETTEETESSAANERSKLQVKEKREQVVKLERERREERERIRNQIQQDKEERKRREAEEKARHTAATAAATPESSLSRSKPTQQCRLQVRLFDGSSVRTSFPPTATIHANVRPWLDAHRSDGNSPYTLKHILTPLPNHTISDAEEERTLEDLSLGPTANLIMVPVPSYIDAYASSSSVASLPFRAASAGYGLMSGVVGAVAGTVGSFLGYGAQQQPAGNNPVDVTTAQQASGPTRSGPSSRGGGINIRTLYDQRDGRDDRQFYNGNQLNFEPRPDDSRKND